MKKYPFIQEAHLRVAGGKGGKGCVHFRREKYVPKGGPDGGDGGKGGSVFITGHSHINTLFHLTRKTFYKAPDGAPGGPKKQTGKSGKDIEIKVPLGTIIFDEERGWKIGEILTAQDRFLVARGGQGGRGNWHFATPSCQAPEKYEEGEPGEERKIYLVLKLLADVGLVGLPNAGKSSLLASLSNAKPKIGPYPFTTKTPHLGVVICDETFQFVMADIPGLIEGAHQGKGMGIEFLKQVERTKLLLHLVDISDGKDPLEKISIIQKELKEYDPALLSKPQILVLTKSDLPEVKKKMASSQKKIRAFFAFPIFPISAVTGRGLAELKREIVLHLKEEPVILI